MKLLACIIGALFIISAGNVMAQEVRYEKNADGTISKVQVQMKTSAATVEYLSSQAKSKISQLQAIRGLTKDDISQVVRILNENRALVEEGKMAWSEIVDRAIAEEQANIAAMDAVLKVGEVSK